MGYMGAERLADLMGVAITPDASIWPPRDRAALFAHQMRSPLLLSRWVSGGHDATPDASDQNGQDWMITWGELLADPEPSLETLRAAKHFAKSNITTSDPALPRELATVLYYAVIAAGLVRVGRSLTDLDHDSLCAGLRWSAGQQWVDEDVSSLLRGALDEVNGAAIPKDD